MIIFVFNQSFVKNFFKVGIKILLKAIFKNIKFNSFYMKNELINIDLSAKVMIDH